MRKTYLLLAVLLGIQLFFLINLQFTAWPEMFSYAYLRNNGFLLYKDMIHPYPPLLTMGLSYIYSIFGYSLNILQSVAWLTILTSTLLVFLVARQFTKKDDLALIATAVYVFLQPFLEGNMLWFDTAIVPAILLGLYFALRNNWFLAGIFLSVAMLTKQTTGLFYVGSVFYLLVTRAHFGKIKNFLLGPLILGTPLVIRLLQEGALTDFLNWTLVYPLTQFGQFPGYVEFSFHWYHALVIIVLFGIPLAALLKDSKLWRDKNLALLILFLIISLIIVYPRVSFFHMQLFIALSAVLWSYLLRQSLLWKGKQKRLIAICLAAGFILLIGMIHPSVLRRDWQKEARFFGQEDKMLAQKIEEATPQGERVFLLGLNSNLYSMAEALPPKRWTDNFGWYLEVSGVQEKILSRWEDSPPALVFWRTPSPGNWFDLGTYQPKKIAAWVEEHYTKDKEVKPGIWIWRKK
ncbi:MAG: glycosyltransferase family 39 protein [bacterium]|nr:glycosyltransferase family 39 protein [bacterium]